MNPGFYVTPEQLVRDRAEFARKGIARGRSILAMEYQDGVLMLAENPGGSLNKISEVYDRIARDLGGGDSLVILRNDNPDPSQLIRSVLIASRTGVDSLTRELALEWRAEIDAAHYNVPQRIDDSNSSVVSFMWEGRPALEVTGVWQDESGGFPAAGPFIVWLVDCPARTYFVDAWLYSPNRPKYEYMLQLQEILGSFRCVEAAA